MLVCSVSNGYSEALARSTSAIAAMAVVSALLYGGMLILKSSLKYVFVSTTVKAKTKAIGLGRGLLVLRVLPVLRVLDGVASSESNARLEDVFARLERLHPHSSRCSSQHAQKALASSVSASVLQTIRFAGVSDIVANEPRRL